MLPEKPEKSAIKNDNTEISRHNLEENLTD